MLRIGSLYTSNMIVFVSAPIIVETGFMEIKVEQIMKCCYWLISEGFVEMRDFFSRDNEYLFRTLQHIMKSSERSHQILRKIMFFFSSTESWFAETFWIRSLLLRISSKAEWRNKFYKDDTMDIKRILRKMSECYWLKTKQ